ncbi:MAG: secondary thiamine-phosphate synthase enzyme YjbQ [Verrucomicrobiota bacterium]|jgi:secondary thiamine-phosphate synthase enzyme|nr:secondary thiamine-phosphate synthase enzyme YjbQ [Verrucomicrobiota bacterium]
MMKISITTSRRTQLVPLTRHIQEALSRLPAWTGLLHVHSPHTTAGVTLNEQADADVAADMEKALARLVPWKAAYAHMEGNSAAHIQTALVGVSAWVPIRDGALAMGTWQGIFLCEFDGPRTRELWLTPIQEMQP